MVTTRDTMRRQWSGRNTIRIPAEYLFRKNQTHNTSTGRHQENTEISEVGIDDFRMPHPVRSGR